MLHPLFRLTLAAGIITATACNQPSSEKTEKPPVKDTVLTASCRQALDKVPQVLCSYTDYLSHRAAYEDLNKKNGMKEPVLAYTVRAVDLLAAMGMNPTLADSAECRYKHIRVYLGFDPARKGFKLYITPVDGACLQDKDSTRWKAGKDVFLDKNGNIINPVQMKNYTADQAYVLDLNAPCPNTCPEEPTFQTTVKK